MDISSLIPQLFYDVIGRIIPGTTLLALAFIIFFGPKDGLTYLATWSDGTLETKVSTALIVLGNLLAAHVLASLLGGFWFLIRHYILDIIRLKEDHIAERLGKASCDLPPEENEYTRKIAYMKNRLDKIEEPAHKIAYLYDY